jgi:hypothetical protein
VRQKATNSAVLLLVAGLMLVLAPSPAWAQGCALCYTQAAAAAPRFIQALRSGILILVIPPAFLYTGITVLAYRKRNRFHDREASSEVDDR